MWFYGGEGIENRDKCATSMSGTVTGMGDAALRVMKIWCLKIETNLLLFVSIIFINGTGLVTQFIQHIVALIQLGVGIKHSK